MRKEGKGMLALWPSLSKLRGLYLDDRAIKAGAKESEMYTDEMIVRRETLRSDNLVQAALEEFWVSVPRLAVDRLSKSEYMTLARKFYLISMIEEGMADQLDSNGWRTDAEQDFAADAHRKDHLTKSDFFASWFECADLHTKDWFGAVSVLELQEREGVKQQARQALDDFVANQEKAKRHAAAKAAMKRLGFSKKSGLTPSMSYDKAFKVLDKDGGGSISVSELKAALVKEGSSEASEAEIQSLIDQVDVNGDGELQLDEFETFWKLFQASVEEAAGPKQELPPVQGQDQDQ
ncbi:calmodulin-like 5 [Chrysochromulina tobinii]|uniref:Calmodulin-like 5 n=1 Tax=Chrysochromulina tobinii TaxID=1460289 RepID=A0A0M0J692_9EUKA|nr:calmodulin-like 5 [Chrysochromulina tobinii]|eukprot:KOO22121.1 calmodulin-like 5 [Chrysochromulina sp. CCMP291]